MLTSTPDSPTYKETWSLSWPRTTSGSPPSTAAAGPGGSAPTGCRCSRPRFSPDGTLLAWASTRDGAPEIHVAPVEGGPARRLTYWGSRADRGGRLDRRRARCWRSAAPGGCPGRTPGPSRCRWTAAPPGSCRTAGSATWRCEPGGDAGAARQRRWAGSPPTGSATGAARPESCGSALGRAAFERVLRPDPPTRRQYRLADVGGRADRLPQRPRRPRPALVRPPDGSDLRRHSDDDEFYARHAATDGTRVVYQSAGDLWLLDDLADARPAAAGAPPRRSAHLPAALPAHRPGAGWARSRRTPRAAPAWSRCAAPSTGSPTGTARCACSPVTPGVRNRLPQALPDGASVWVTDAEGEDALEFSDGRRVAAGRARPGRGAGRLPGRRAARRRQPRRPGAAGRRPADRCGSSTAARRCRPLAWPSRRTRPWLAWSHGADLSERLRQIRFARVDGAAGLGHRGHLAALH